MFYSKSPLQHIFITRSHNFWNLSPGRAFVKIFVIWSYIFYDPNNHLFTNIMSKWTCMCMTLVRKTWIFANLIELMLSQNISIARCLLTPSWLRILSIHTTSQVTCVAALNTSLCLKQLLIVSLTSTTMLHNQTNTPFHLCSFLTIFHVLNLHHNVTQETIYW